MRNQNLDVLKAVSAYFVILIHISLPGIVGESVKAVARFAVPVFFMASGYFCYKKEGIALEKLRGRIQHLFYLLAGALLFYLIWKCVQRGLTAKPAFSWLKELADPANLKNLILFNRTSVIRAHLWFLPALLYCYLLYYIIRKFHLESIAFWMIPLLLFCHFYREEARVLTGIPYSVMTVRNYLFTGFPFFMLGNWIHKKEEVLRGKMTVPVLMTVGFLGGVCSIWECLLLGQMELYAGSAVLAVSLFMGAIWLEKDLKVPGLAAIGQKYAVLLYILHPAVGDLLKDVGNYLGIQKQQWFLWSKPFMVCVLVTVFAVGMKKISACLWERAWRKGKGQSSI